MRTIDGSYGEGSGQIPRTSLALAGGGEFRTLALTAHTETNLQVIHQLLPLAVEVMPEPSGAVTVRLGGAVDH